MCLFYGKGGNTVARFCPLFSGSSGNCLYVGNADSGILIDAGVSARRIETALAAREIAPSAIRAILVTHEHSDHTSGLRVFQKRYHTPIYASHGTLAALLEEKMVAETDNCFPVEEICLDDFEITAFPTSHDCRESNGFRIVLRDGRTVGIATDLGYVTEAVREGLCGCDLVHIESNHDVRMLENGPYPYPLKRRILSERGHLSNEACAAELSALLQNGTTRVMLGHLSRENNLPALAHATALAALQVQGAVENRDFTLQVAPPENAVSPLIF